MADRKDDETPRRRAGATDAQGSGAAPQAGESQGQGERPPVPLSINQDALSKDPNEPGSDPYLLGTAPAGTAPLPEGIKAEEIASRSAERVRAADEAAVADADAALEDARRKDEETLARQAAMRPQPSQEEADRAARTLNGPAGTAFRSE